MLPIIYENKEMNYNEYYSMTHLLKDYDTLINTIKYFISSYHRMMKNTDDKNKFINSNTALLVRSIDKCIYKFTQKHFDYGVYLKKVKRINNVLLTNTSDKIKLRLITKMLQNIKHI